MDDSIARRFMSVMDVIQCQVQGLFTFCYGIRTPDAVNPGVGHCVPARFPGAFPEFFSAARIRAAQRFTPCLRGDKDKPYYGTGFLRRAAFASASGNRSDREVNIMENDQAAYGGRTGAPESLLALAEYLERALDKATCVVMMRHAPDVCTVYLGDPAEPREELKKIGTIAASLADDMLGLTSSGGNDIRIGDQPYRFVRSFTQMDGVAAVVFSA